MTYWICGKNIEEVESGIVWEIGGVFSSEEKAIKACTDKNYFIGPIELDQKLPDETTKWDGCYYPYYVNRSEDEDE
jgi:hypothetical protein